MLLCFALLCLLAITALRASSIDSIDGIESKVINPLYKQEWHRVNGIEYPAFHGALSRSLTEANNFRINQLYFARNFYLHRDSVLGTLRAFVMKTI